MESRSTHPGAGSHWIVTFGFRHKLSRVGQEGPGSSRSGAYLRAKKAAGKLTRKQASMNTSRLLVSGALDLLVKSSAAGNRPRH